MARVLRSVAVDALLPVRSQAGTVCPYPSVKATRLTFGTLLLTKLLLHFVFCILLLIWGHRGVTGHRVVMLPSPPLLCDSSYIVLVVFMILIAWGVAGILYSFCQIWFVCFSGGMAFWKDEDRGRVKSVRICDSQVKPSHRCQDCICQPPASACSLGFNPQVHPTLKMQRQESPTFWRGRVNSKLIIWDSPARKGYPFSSISLSSQSFVYLGRESSVFISESGVGSIKSIK